MSGEQTSGAAGDWEERAGRLAARSYASGDPTGWFDPLYEAGVAGEVGMPWDRAEPQPQLVEWAERAGLAGGPGMRAVVVGCGLGADAEYVSGRGFDTVGFDIAETAVRLARERNPGSGVRYTVADLLDPPAGWLRSFDLVVEIFTVQALPDPPRATAIANVGRLVASGGTLVVIAFCRSGADDAADEGPPWPLTRDEIDAFAAGGLRQVRVEVLPHPTVPDSLRWRAELRRPGS